MLKRKIGKLLSLLLGLSILLVACNSSGGSSDSPTVTIMGSVTGKGEEELKQVLAPFTEETGIKVVYEGTDAFATLLPVRVDSGNPPDIAMFPQPGLMADFARDSQLVPLDTVLKRSQLSEAFSQNWLDLGTVDGKLYGIWYRVFAKSLVWYSPEAFAAKGYKVPTTWDEMMALSDKIVADGGVPWCLGMASGDATGWVGTDWVEDIMLRTAGAKIYDQWMTHKIPFNDSAVKNAFEEFGKIALNPNYIVGGTTGAISIPFGDSPKPLFDKTPGCYMHRQATFIASFFPETVMLGKDVDVFPLPGIKKEFGVPMLVGGEVVAMFNDTPEAQQLIEYLTTVKPHEILAGIKGYISPHKQVSLEAYPNAVTKRQAKLLAEAEIIRYDASDMMPGAVGTGAFWTGIVDYVGGKDVDRVLKDIEESWSAAD
ncbi:MULTISPECIES: ABC transporter substrate-binding protein [unclassified Coleofasciculus]|uniref:ABC transporter substrate-binding protein n=1 Tax=unclassified Coleofasciculus TaxID=2692782 RepID=UPI00187EA670|nr:MULTISPECIES: ABC transporter substrate-binding protein [unclassified Coleofasciculus]MBE9128953.1 carbohydrate ABC transporter substrate-binding protein [Coleofasciculus sp. LEGE 07081]MBE9148282.1 carbohydrate ABC transporter substrate-binding protein [Coleofasciculus sp. LEGE 07092]